jgi:hypothetical protein
MYPTTVVVHKWLEVAQEILDDFDPFHGLNTSDHTQSLRVPWLRILKVKEKNFAQGRKSTNARLTLNHLRKENRGKS